VVVCKQISPVSYMSGYRHEDGDISYTGEITIETMDVPVYDGESWFIARCPIVAEDMMGNRRGFLSLARAADWNARRFL